MILYRAYISWFDEGINDFEITYTEFEIIRETKFYYYARDRKIAKDINGIRPYAWNTKEKAVKSLLARRLKNLSILESRLAHEPKIIDYVQSQLSLFKTE